MIKVSCGPSEERDKSVQQEACRRSFSWCRITRSWQGASSSVTQCSGKQLRDHTTPHNNATQHLLLLSRQQWGGRGFTAERQPAPCPDTLPLRSVCPSALCHLGLRRQRARERRVPSCYAFDPPYVGGFFFFFFLACEVEHHFYFSAWPKTGGLQRPVATEADQEPRSQEITVWQSSNTTALGYDGLMSLFIIIIPLCREWKREREKEKKDNSYFWCDG